MTVEMLMVEEKEAGIKIGLEQGIEKGLVQGLEQKAIETAKNLKRMNLTTAQISEATGLSIEEIESL